MADILLNINSDNGILENIRQTEFTVTLSQSSTSIPAQ